MKRSILLGFLILLLFSQCEDKQEYKSYVPDADMEMDVLDEINSYRVSSGLPELVMDSLIRALSREHNNDMTSGKLELGHDGFESRANQILEQKGGGAVGENVASGYSSAQSVVEAWLNSPTHKENIDGDYSKTGIGVMKDDKGVYFYTQMFWGERK